MLSRTRAVAVLCAFCFAIAIPMSAAAHTTVMAFNPWASSGLRPGFTVSGNGKGSCWTHSLSTDRPDAWRCFEGNNILDPCFAGPPRFAVVACAESPFSPKVVLLRLSKALSSGDNPTTKWLQPKGMPWGLRLSNGDTCVFVTGATDAVGGERLNYACRKTGWIIGAPDSATGTWTARSVDWPNKHVTEVGIATAIF
jgi:hypothetical protein